MCKKVLEVRRHLSTHTAFSPVNPAEAMCYTKSLILQTQYMVSCQIGFQEIDKDLSTCPGQDSACDLYHYMCFPITRLLIWQYCV